MKGKRVLLLSDLHYCQEEYGGISIDEKAERIIRQINEEHKKCPFDMILFLGDYSLDYWAWSTRGTWITESKSYTKLFVDRYCRSLPAPFYMLPGNHEQYDEEQWQQITGFHRSAHFVIGDYLFILWDSFGADLNPTEHTDGTYTPPNVGEILDIMSAHPEKKVILCSHSFQPTFAEEECALIRDSRVVCLFQGHTHHSGVITLPEEYGSKKLIQTGAWAFTSPVTNLPWGIRDLYLKDDRIFSGYIVPSQRLFHKGQAYTVSARYQDTVEIVLSAMNEKQ